MDDRDDIEIQVRCPEADSRGKFGRILGEIWVNCNEDGHEFGGWTNVNKWMCDKDAILGPIFKTAWTKYNSKAYLTYYVKDEDMDENNPYICPIKGDFTNSPPILIHVGTEELLLSDSRSMINALERDNVEYEYKEWDELWHVFQLESLIPEAQESFSLISKFLNKYI